MPKINLKERFGKQFKVELGEVAGTAREYIIRHRWPNELGRGEIFAYESGRLGCFMAGLRKFGNLKKEFPSIKLVQRGAAEFVFAFDADLLPEIATALKARRRRQYSEKTLAKMRRNMLVVRQNRFSRKKSKLGSVLQKEMLSSKG